ALQKQFPLLGTVDAGRSCAGTGWGFVCFYKEPKACYNCFAGGIYPRRSGCRGRLLLSRQWSAAASRGKHTAALQRYVWAAHLCPASVRSCGYVGRARQPSAQETSMKSIFPAVQDALLPRDPVTQEPIPPRQQPGYYPGFNTLSQRRYWDEATRRVVEERVNHPP